MSEKQPEHSNMDAYEKFLRKYLTKVLTQEQISEILGNQTLEHFIAVQCTNKSLRGY